MLRKKLKLTNEHEQDSTSNHTDYNMDYNYYPYQYQSEMPPTKPTFSNVYHPYAPYDNTATYYHNDVGLSRFFPVPVPASYIPPVPVPMPMTNHQQSVHSVPPMSLPPTVQAIPLSDQFLQIEQQLNMNLAALQYQHPENYVVYNPIEYAYNAHAAFVTRYCANEKRVLLLGMNPGPHGMCQTGIPFGNTDVCKEWFHIDVPVGQPSVQCPSRKIVGFDYKQQEVSGKRLWTVFKNLCGSAENFFRYSYIHNYCPLAFFDEKGKNKTPSDLRGQFKKNLEEHCDRALYAIIQLLKCEIVIAIGVYAEQRVLSCLRNNNPCNTRVLRLPHPSPMAKNNQNWVEKAPGVLQDIGVIKYFTRN